MEEINIERLTEAFWVVYERLPVMLSPALTSLNSVWGSLSSALSPILPFLSPLSSILSWIGTIMTPFYALLRWTLALFSFATYLFSPFRAIFSIFYPIISAIFRSTILKYWYELLTFVIISFHLALCLYLVVYFLEGKTRKSSPDPQFVQTLFRNGGCDSVLEAPKVPLFVQPTSNGGNSRGRRMVRQKVRRGRAEGETAEQNLLKNPLKEHVEKLEGLTLPLGGILFRIGLCGVGLLLGEVVARKIPFLVPSYMLYEIAYACIIGIELDLKPSFSWDRTISYEANASGVISGIIWGNEASEKANGPFSPDKNIPGCRRMEKLVKKVAGIINDFQGKRNEDEDEDREGAMRALGFALEPKNTWDNQVQNSETEKQETNDGPESNQHNKRHNQSKSSTKRNNAMRTLESSLFIFVYLGLFLGVKFSKWIIFQCIEIIRS